MELTNRMLIGLGRAIGATTEAGRSAHGWIRLARVRSRQDENKNTYVIAIRETKQGLQFGCSCPHWIYRVRHNPGALCKHQELFLGHTAGTAPKTGVWLYRAGKAFLQQTQKGT